MLWEEARKKKELSDIYFYIKSIKASTLTHRFVMSWEIPIFFSFLKDYSVKLYMNND